MARPRKPVGMPTYPALAAALRAYMEAEGIGPSELTERLGYEPRSTNVYPWIRGSSAPGTSKMRARVAKLLKTDEATLFPASISNHGHGGARPGAGRPRALPAPGAPTMPTPSTADLMQVSFKADGSARLRLDVTLNHARMMPLLRVLMDAGLVVENSGE